MRPLTSTSNGKAFRAAMSNSFSLPAGGKLVSDADGYKVPYETDGSSKGVGRNYILSHLSQETLDRLEPNLETLELKLRTEVYQQEDKMTHLYFPHDTVLSLVTMLEDGSSVEVGLAGFEGFVCVDAILSDGKNPHSLNQIIAQIEGRATRLRVDVALEEFKRGGDFQHLVLNYMRTLFVQMNHSVVANIRCTLEQRLCRWLLMVHDRVPGDELKLTQEFIAQMLGVRRAGVSVAAGILQQMNMIEYRRGHITILDRKGLEETAGSHYTETKGEFDLYINN
jgi:CRP-like cAMP-binding protein